MIKVTKAEIAAHREIAYEEIYAAADVRYELTKINIGDIERHFESQIRLQQANPTRVNQYLAQFKAGGTPPPVTVYEDGFNGYRITDANHRVAMYLKAKESEIWAYVLTGITEAQSVWIGAALNGLHGLPLSAGEIERGVVMGLALDYKPETIARTIGASISKVNRVIRIKKFETRARSLGLLVDKINDTMKDKLSGITDDTVFVAAVELQRDAEMAVEEWSARDFGLLAKLKAANSETERLAVLGQARDDRETAIKAVRLGKVPHVSPTLEIRNILLRAEKAVGGYPLDAWVPNGATAEEWVGRVELLRNHLNTVLTEVTLP